MGERSGIDQDHELLAVAVAAAANVQDSSSGTAQMPQRAKAPTAGCCSAGFRARIALRGTSGTWG
eukprot:7724787-Heterocapsa_arctica.AAC.1